MKKTYKILIVFLMTNIIVLSLIISSHYISEYRVNKLEGEKTRETYLSIVTTNKFIYNMVKTITGDMHDVTYMSKEENELWDFKYTDDSVKNISKKDLFIFSGANYEPWSSSFVEDLKRDKVTAINASRGIRTINYSEGIKYNDKTIKENPYYWMNPEEYKTALVNIKNAIAEKDPKNLNFYNSNFDEEIEKINEFIGESKKISSSISDYTFLLKDERLEYLFKFMGVKYTNISNKEKEIKLYEKEKTNLNQDKNSRENLKLAYIYIRDDDFKIDEKNIKEYSMKPVKLKSYDSESQYIDFMYENLYKIKELIENKRIDRK